MGSQDSSSRWHWQSRQEARRDDVARTDLAKRDVAPLHQLLCKCTYEAWKRSKRLSSTLQSEVKDACEHEGNNLECEERFKSWLKAKQAMSSRQNKGTTTKPNVQRPELPPFKPRLPRHYSSTAPPKNAKAPHCTEPQPKDSTKANAAYGKWLRKKAAEHIVARRQAKAQADARESARYACRRQVHANTWVKQAVVVLAYSCPVQPRRR
ncbi:hypothetical protein H257_03106 [Aphanomyces astaci]|uniref:Uncharacterized protein n=1 Tax=Aphanomyces astaci TaxID=112090 RepID=W4H097_APHAT|nr:hypothetical protein H257_03106 [Aphanomyces astaci]ETV85342.1 hypothetical protein H257_03106 [Aphanomyces astaci]|eukprot:XP_009825360.1 hypothetical protein H257_03106 [Aphanomyces astaci]